MCLQMIREENTQKKKKRGLWVDPFNGNTYSSLKELCSKYPVSVNTVRNKLKSGQSLAEILNKGTVTDHEGNVFKSVKEKCSFHNVSLGTYNSRIARGWSEEKALTPASNENKYFNNLSKETEDHLGNKFKSISEKCRHWDITYKLYTDRMANGWDEEKALTTPSRYASSRPKDGTRKYPTMFDGIDYGTFQNLCRSKGVGESTVRARLDRGVELSEALKPTNKTVQVVTDHLGNIFEDKNQKCEFHHINPFTYDSRIRKGWSEEKALTTPVKQIEKHDRAKSVFDHEGNEFSSIKEKCEFWDIPYNIYNERIKRGYSEEKALTKPYKAKKATATDHLGNVFANIKEKCAYWEIGYSTYMKNIKNGMDEESALTTKSRGLVINPFTQELQPLMALLEKYSIPYISYSRLAKDGWSLKDILTDNTVTSRTKDEKVKIWDTVSYAYKANDMRYYECRIGEKIEFLSEDEIKEQENE